MVMSYTRDELLAWKHTGNVALGWNTLHSIINAGLSAAKPTHRGTSAGKNKWHPVNSFTGGKGKQINCPPPQRVCANIHTPLQPISNVGKPSKPMKLCVINFQSSRNKADVLADYVAEHDFDLCVRLGLRLVMKTRR